MQALPNYVTSIFLLLWTILRVTHPSSAPLAAGYTTMIDQMMLCHEALIEYAEANPTGYNSNVGSAAIDPYLPKGATDPNIGAPIPVLIYQYLSTGVVQTYVDMTYINTAVPSPSVAADLLQNFTRNLVTAGVVKGGAIMYLPFPASSAVPVAVGSGVPNGTIAIQTTLF